MRNLTERELSIVATIPLLQDAQLRAAVLAASSIVSLEAGESVLVEGQCSEAFYVVIDGQLEVTVAGATGPCVLGTLTAGDWFGEEATLRGRPRSATVRTLRHSRCIEVPRAVFESHVLADPHAHEALAERAELRLAERSLRSLAFFSDLDPDEEIAGNVVRRVFAAGDVVFAAGTPADTMALVLDGIVQVRRTQEPLRLGPGQCVGEQDVLTEQLDRTHDVIAETAGSLLEVKAARFRRWVDHDCELAEWIGTLQHVYRTNAGRLLTVYEATVNGHPCAVTVHGDPSVDGVTTTDRLDGDLLEIARCRRPAIAETVRFVDGTRTRELGLANVERDHRGRVRTGELVHARVEHTGADVGQLYRRIFDGGHVAARDLSRFARTGYLGGTTKPGDQQLLCQCLQIAPADVAHCTTVDEVRCATGAGMVCGGCKPAIAALVRIRAATPAAPAPAVQPIAAPAVVDDGCRVPEVREHAFAFASAPLREVKAVPEVLLIAVTSLLSSSAERFIIAAIGEAAPRIADRKLAAAIQALIAQESNHIAQHAPLNRMLVDEVYPYADRLRRLGDQMLVRFGKLPLAERLAVAAAYEYASDSIFGAVYETHYREGKRFHRDPAVHAALVASGVGPLFSWHALEELGHRHVAFEAALALGVTRRQLRRGMLRVLADLARLQFPAILQLLRGEPDASVLGFARAVFGDPGFVRTFALRLVRFMRRDFDPAQEHYEFADELARDVDHHAEAN